MPKPVVAAVNGVAAGAGAAFAFACDLRIVADTAGFNLAFTGDRPLRRLRVVVVAARLVGAAKAKELLLLPRTVGAQEALDLGLATEVVPDADLAAGSRELARQLAAGPTWPTAPSGRPSRSRRRTRSRSRWPTRRSSWR